MLIPHRREIPLGHLIPGRSPDPSCVVEFDHVPMDIRLLPSRPEREPILTYVSGSDKRLEWCARWACGNERAFVDACNRANIAPMWWINRGYRYDGFNVRPSHDCFLKVLRRYELHRYALTLFGRGDASSAWSACESTRVLAIAPRFYRTDAAFIEHFDECARWGATYIDTAQTTLGSTYL